MRPHEFRKSPFYYIGPLYDGILSSGGQLQYFIDQDGGIDTRLAKQVNVLDYASFQAAHDALPAAGGVIIVPPGTYYLSGLQGPHGHKAGCDHRSGKWSGERALDTTSR
jgi:hypothetical protein